MNSEAGESLYGRLLQLSTTKANEVYHMPDMDAAFIDSGAEKSKYLMNKARFYQCLSISLSGATSYGGLGGAAIVLSADASSWLRGILNGAKNGWIVKGAGKGKGSQDVQGADQDGGQGGGQGGRQSRSSQMPNFMCTDPL